MLADNTWLNFISILIGIITIIISLVLIRILTKKSRGNAFLLVGLPNSGKTLIFIQLTAKRFYMTVTSMQCSENVVKLTNKSVRLVDLPGYERVREKFWDEHRQRGRGIIFVIDSVNFTNTIRDVADLLYNTLVDHHVRNSKIPVLIACNKQDQSTAKSARVIETQLKREMLAVRETRRGALDSISDDSKHVLLGRSDSDFSFTDLSTPVEFVECSALKYSKSDQPQDSGNESGEESNNYVGDLKPVLDWMHRVS